MISIRFAKRNIRRSPFQALAASMAMFSAFFALLTFLLIAGGSQAVLKYYESKPQVIAFFKDGTKMQDITAIQNALEKTDKIASTKYISKDEAFQIYRNLTKDKPELVEAVTANTLPQSLEVSTKTPEDLGPIADILKKEPVVDDVVLPRDLVQNITSGARFIRIVGATLVGYLILFATLQVLMIISFKIRLKRDEIEIMRLLGASPGFIRKPFLLEGIFYGVVGAISSWIAVYSLIWFFEPFIKNFFLGEVQLLPINPLFMLAILGIEIIVAAIVGSLGAYGAVRRYLHV
jgi:cell division transport system permease protein